ncbi:MAG: hypothetical protein FPO08_01095 [Geobacter sp.]|nr:MAG: hypothetical protein FPO08_01095 [Geobacter sp.]
MIEVAQGSPGSGKSAVAVARAVAHLKRGGIVAANFSLVDGWAESVASHHPFVRVLKFLRMGSAADRLVYKLSSSLYKRFYRVDSVEAIRSINPRTEAVGILKDDGRYSEGIGLLLLDECQLVFNSRKWEKNMVWIEFFTQHRKLGWDVVLIAHDIQMIDAQIRPLAEYESRFRNMQKLRFPVIGLPMAPFPLFIVIKRYAGLGAGASVIASRDLFPLPLWAAKLYDSLEVFSQEQWSVNTLPRLCGKAPAPPSGVGAPVPSPLRCSVLIGPHWDQYLQTLPTASVKTSLSSHEA